MKQIFQFSQTQIITRTQFQNKPANLHSFYQQSTKPNTQNNLVVFHGLFGSHTNFRTIVKDPKIRELANSYSMDLRNHGLSEHKPTMSLQDQGEDIVNFLEEKNLNNVILMGHSMGGRAVLSALKNNSKQLQKLVKGVIIVDITPGNQIAGRPVDSMEMWIMINQLMEMNLNGKSKVAIEKEVRQIILNPQIANFMMMNIVQEDDNIGNYKWRVNLKAICDYYKSNLETEIKDVNWEGPCSIICGERSNFTNKQKISEFETVFPNMDIERDVHFIKGAGHWVHADKPVEFIDKIHEFILRIK